MEDKNDVGVNVVKIKWNFSVNYELIILSALLFWVFGNQSIMSGILTQPSSSRKQFGQVVICIYIYTIDLLKYYKNRDDNIHKSSKIIRNRSNEQ